MGIEYPEGLKWRQSRKENELVTVWTVGLYGKCPGSVCIFVSLRDTGDLPRRVARCSCDVLHTRTFI